MPGEHFADATSFRVFVGGAESNVCAALAQLGRRTSWVSALPDNPLGDLVLARLNAARIDTQSVVVVPNSRIGTYYLKTAAIPNTTVVVYDRVGSAFTTLTRAQLDLDAVLNASIFHVTGITPALGDRPRQLLTEVIREARDKGVLVSFDVNYRHSLWSATEARTVLRPLIAMVDIVFCSVRDASQIFGAAPSGASAANTLRDHSNAELVVITLGDQGIYALHGQTELVAPAVPTRIIDRPGAGDALVAGVLDGVLDGDIDAGLSRGTMLAAMALSHHGDMLSVSRRELITALSDSKQDIVR